MSWNDVEEIFRKYDKTNSDGIYLADCVEALREAGLIVEDNEIIEIMDQEEWSISKVSLLRFQYIFERLNAVSDPEAVDEMSARVRRGKLATWVRITDKRKEDGRRSRRTVFVDSDWKKFRSSYRLIDNLATFAGRNSVLRSVWLEVSMVFAFSTVVWGYNSFATSYSGAFDKMFPQAASMGIHLSTCSLPPFPFIISSGALGLLLIFRTDWAYARYRDARALWGDVADISKRLLSRADVAFIDQEAVDQFDRRLLAFALVLKKHVRGGKKEEDFLWKELSFLLGEEQGTRLKEAQNRPYMALHDLSQLLAQQRSKAEAAAHNASLPPPCIPERVAAMESEVLLLVDKVGAMERIYRGPTPLAYTRFTGRYLALWTLMVPLGLWKELGGSWSMIPMACLLSVFFFGIDELGTQIEEPFSLLPLEWFCEGIESVAAELAKKRSDLATGDPPPDFAVASDVRALRGSEDF